jgi:hypothetical protein
MWTALWQSCVFFFIPVMVYDDHKGMWHEDGKTSGIWVFGTQSMSTAVIVICLKMMADTKHWIWIYYFSTVTGIVMYFLTLAVVSSASMLENDPDFYYVMEKTFSSPLNWLVMFVQIVMCMAPGVLYNLFQRERNASLSTVLYEAQKFGYLNQENGMTRSTKDIVEDYMRR